MNQSDTLSNVGSMDETTNVQSVPSHPEPHTYAWTAQEQKTILEYARHCVSIAVSTEREACRIACRSVASPDGDEYACGYNQGALDCEAAIFKRG